jgi:hypothetical protein
MSDSDGSEGSSSSSQEVPFYGAESSGYNIQDIPSSLPLVTYRTSLFNLPNPARIRYSNKEFAKVNAGIDTGEWMADVQTVFSMNKPVVNIDFSRLKAPIIAPEAKPTTETLVRRLLDPLIILSYTA